MSDGIESEYEITPYFSKPLRDSIAPSGLPRADILITRVHLWDDRVAVLWQTDGEVRTVLLA